MTRRGRARSEAPAESGPRPPSGGTSTPKARRKTGLNAFKKWEQKYGVGPRRRGGTEERWRNLQQYLQKTRGLAGQVRALDTKIFGFSKAPGGPPLGSLQRPFSGGLVERKRRRH